MYSCVTALRATLCPKARARSLKSWHGDQKLAVVLAVDGKGHAAIKGLVMNGELVYEEPLIW